MPERCSRSSRSIWWTLPGQRGLGVPGGQGVQLFQKRRDSGALSGTGAERLLGLLNLLQKLEQLGGGLPLLLLGRVGPGCRGDRSVDGLGRSWPIRPAATPPSARPRAAHRFRRNAVSSRRSHAHSAGGAAADPESARSALPSRRSVSAGALSRCTASTARSSSRNDALGAGSGRPLRPTPEGSGRLLGEEVGSGVAASSTGGIRIMGGSVPPKVVVPPAPLQRPCQPSLAVGSHARINRHPPVMHII